MTPNDADRLRLPILVPVRVLGERFGGAHEL
jgi:hypothetical protein